MQATIRIFWHSRQPLPLRNPHCQSCGGVHRGTAATQQLLSIFGYAERLCINGALNLQANERGYLLCPGSSLVDQQPQVEAAQQCNTP